MAMMRPSDVIRAGVVVGSALFAVIVTTAAAPRIEDVAGAGPRSPIEPATYAFAIWALIFGLILVYAVYQALPRNLPRPLNRQIGWWTALAFTGTGLWSLAVSAERLTLAQGLLLLMGGALGVAYLRVARNPDLLPADRWLVALPIAPFVGWLTAANAVSLHARAVDLGLLAADRRGAIVGAVLLLVAGGVAAWVVRVGQRGPIQLWGGYTLTIVWALVGIVVNQGGLAAIGTIAALLAALPVIAIVFTGPHPPRGHNSATAPSAS